MRILLITQWCDPEPTFKGLLFAQELRRQGHEVEILTGFPNYPGGKLYPGYRVKPFQRELLDGIPVLRVPLYPSHDQSGARRALNYLTFAASASLGALLMRRPDVAYVYHPPATVGLPAMILKALKGVPFVYDIQDLWPDTLAATGMLERAALLKPVDWWMKQVYRQAAHLTVLSGGFKQTLQSRGVPHHKITVIPNWMDEQQIKLSAVSPQRARELGFGDKFNVVFAGTMGKAQALGTVLEAAEQLRDESVRFVLVGGGVEVEPLTARAKQAGLPNVTFLPRRPPAEIGELLSLADALLVHLKDDPLFAITIPSKTQAYLKAGRPILMGVRGDAAEMVERAGAGLAFEPEQADDLARAVRQLMALSTEQRSVMGQAGERYYQEHLSLATGTERFTEIFKLVIQQPPPGLKTKRLIDIALSGLLLGVGSVPLLLLAGLVRLRLGSPVLFKQERPGLNGQPFTLLKFRSMTGQRGPDGALLPDADRLTPFGQFLRSSSLDELPALCNVLRGEMSLVGPRPLLMQYLDLYTPEQSRRHEVRPGLTGWAQVNGRNAISWEEKFKLDVWYIDHHNLWLDLKILWLTVLKVIKRDGINAAGEATMPVFTGQ